MNSQTLIPGPKPRRNLFGFLDETGSIHDQHDVFGLGLVTLHKVGDLHREIINYRNRVNYHDEFKFVHVRAANVGLYKGLVDLFFSTKNAQFHAVLYDEQQLDISKHFGGDGSRAYNSFASRLIAKSLDTSDYIAILADDLHTKKSDNFEKQVKEKIEHITRRNALFGICKLESHAVSEIQLADVLLGTIAHAYKIQRGTVIPSKNSGKLKLVKHFQKTLNIPILSENLILKLRNGVVFSVEDFFNKK